MVIDKLDWKHHFN